MLRPALTIISVILLACQFATAQEAAPKPTAVDAIKRLQLLRMEYPTEAYASMIFTIDVVPGGIVARHTHPGIEMGYVLEGEGTLQVDGQPELMMKPGTPYKVPPATPHSGKNTGDKPLKIIATFVVEKDKPLATPAPLP